MRAYHFVGKRLRNGQAIPPDGEWLEYAGPMPLILCQQGLHASEHPFDALTYTPGPTLCLVELAGEILRDTDKCVATRRRILRRADATESLLAFSRQCALDVAHFWQCPDVVRRYLETGDSTLRDAAKAAWAAWAAKAAWAASDAAWEKYRGWFATSVEALWQTVRPA